MREEDILNIIFRKGPTGGREQAARTAEVCGGELAELAPLIRSRDYPPIKPAHLEPVQKPRLTARMVDETIVRDGYDAAANLAESAGWTSGLVAKIRERRWKPNKKPGDGAGVDQNNGRFEDRPPNFLRKNRFGGNEAKARSAEINRKKSRRPVQQAGRWNPHVEKRRAEHI